MKKVFKLFFGRFFWIGLILLVELALIIIFTKFGEAIVEIFVAAIFVLMGLESQFDADTFSMIFQYTTTISLFILDFIVMAYIINSKANSAYKITWLFVVGLFPVIGCVLYWMFGNKNTTKRMRKKIQPIKDATKFFDNDPKIIEELMESSSGRDAVNIAKYIEQSGGTNITKNTEVTYYPSGEDVWPVMLEELKKAKQYIFVEYFIIGKGKFFGSIEEILIKKAKEGVDVRMMYDDVGSIGTISSGYARKMRKLGVKCYAYNRFKPFVNVKLNNRDHRKILVIDGKVGFTGGINLADEYVNIEERFGYWKDNSIMIKGEAVHNMTQLFLANYHRVAKTDLNELSDPKYFPVILYKKDGVNPSGYVQPYGDIPFDDESIGENVYVKLINKATRYIYITTPYLIIDDEMINALVNAAKGGIDVKLITPHIPDKKMVFGVTRSYYRPLIEAGVKIYEFTPGFVHEKMFIVDDVFGTVGTINLDYRSLYLHLENGCFMYKCECLKDMKKDYEDTIAKSELIDAKRYEKIRKHKKVWWALLRIFAPLM